MSSLQVDLVNLELNVPKLCEKYTAANRSSCRTLWSPMKRFSRMDPISLQIFLISRSVYDEHVIFERSWPAPIFTNLSQPIGFVSMRWLCLLYTAKRMLTIAYVAMQTQQSWQHVCAKLNFSIFKVFSNCFQFHLDEFTSDVRIAKII